MLAVAPAAMAEDVYRLDVVPSEGRIQVRAELRELKAGEVLCLPAFGQRLGEHLTLQSVQLVGAEDKAFDHAGCLRAVREGDARFEYTLRMEELAEGHYWSASALSPLHQGGYLVFPGESLFVERGVKESPSGAAETIVYISDETQTVSTLRVNALQEGAGGHSQSYRARDRFELTRSYWAFGQFKMLVASSDKVTWRLAVDEAWQTSIPTIERELSQILEYYSLWMPQQTPDNISIYLFSVPYDASYHQGIARPGGIILELGANAASRAEERRVLMAHELFHLYNGEGLRFDPSKYGQTAWFREGMTQYMAFKSLLAIGLITREQLHHWMAQSISKQRGGVYDAYYHGFFVSYAIELQWALYRTPYNLENFWAFLGSSKQWHDLHTNDSIRRLLMQYSAFDFDNFFKLYIPENARLPVTDLLKRNALNVGTTQVYHYSSGIEYGLDTKNARLYARRVEKNGPAWQAGLRKGDILIPERNTNWNDDSDKRVTVVRGNQRILYRIPVTAFPVTEFVISY